MAKKIKVFESGNYPQGEFNSERVKKIFGSITEPVQAIYAHTSKWDGEEPVEIGNFSDFEIKEDGEKTHVYAKANLNEKGLGYYKDKILKGISVEIDKAKDTLLKVAGLPIGVKQAVTGAEFENITVEFEEIEVETVEDQPKEELTLDKFKEIFGDEYEIVPKKKEEEKKEFSKDEVEEIKKQVRAEFEKDLQAEKSKNEFLEKYKDKLTPKIKEFMTEELITKIFRNEETLEFGDKSISIVEFMTKLVEELPSFKTESVRNSINFEDKKDNETDYERAMRIAKEKTEKRYGGK